MSLMAPLLRMAVLRAVMTGSRYSRNSCTLSASYGSSLSVLAPSRSKSALAMMAFLPKMLGFSAFRRFLCRPRRRPFTWFPLNLLVRGKRPGMSSRGRGTSEGSREEWKAWCVRARGKKGRGRERGMRMCVRVFVCERRDALTTSKLIPLCPVVSLTHMVKDGVGRHGMKERQRFTEAEKNKIKNKASSLGRLSFVFSFSRVVEPRYTLCCFIYMPEFKEASHAKQQRS